MSVRGPSACISAWASVEGLCMKFAKGNWKTTKSGSIPAGLSQVLLETILLVKFRWRMRSWRVNWIWSIFAKIAKVIKSSAMPARRRECTTLQTLRLFRGKLARNPSSTMPRGIMLRFTMKTKRAKEWNAKSFKASFRSVRLPTAANTTTLNAFKNLKTSALWTLIKAGSDVHCITARNAATTQMQRSTTRPSRTVCGVPKLTMWSAFRKTFLTSTTARRSSAPTAKKYKNIKTLMPLKIFIRLRKRPNLTTTPSSFPNRLSKMQSPKRAGTPKKSPGRRGRQHNSWNQSRKKKKNTLKTSPTPSLIYLQSLISITTTTKEIGANTAALGLPPTSQRDLGVLELYAQCTTLPGHKKKL